MLSGRAVWSCGVIALRLLPRDGSARVAVLVVRSAQTDSFDSRRYREAGLLVLRCAEVGRIGACFVEKLSHARDHGAAIEFNA